jgi:hypothetical protein
MSAAFVTEDGVEVPAVTAAEMREIDRIAVETGPNLFARRHRHPGRRVPPPLLGAGTRPHLRGIGDPACRQ